MNTLTYRNSTKKGSTADPRFTLDPKGMATFGDGDKARPVVEIAHESHTIRIVPPKNLYVPNGANVATVTVTIGVNGVELAATKAVAPVASGDGAVAPAFDMDVATGLVGIPSMLAGYLQSCGMASTAKAAKAMAADFIASQ